MTIKTQIKEIFTGNQNLKAKANLLLDDSFLIRDIRIVEGKSGLFISFPVRRVDDKFRDVCYPLNAGLREEIKELILGEYNRTLEKTQPKMEHEPGGVETVAEACSYGEPVAEPEAATAQENPIYPENEIEDILVHQEFPVPKVPVKRQPKKRAEADMDDADE